MGIGAAWLLYAALFAWLAVHHHERASNGTEYVSVVVTVCALCLALPGLILGTRQLRSGLWIDPQLVIVRGMFRTRRFAPNELDGFKVEKRLAPTPVLHREHGPPLLVGALAHGGWLKSRDETDRRALEPICDQLNVLLHSVQTELPTRSPAELALRPSDRAANQAKLRQISIVSTAGTIAACIAIGLLLRTVAATAFVTAIAFAQAAGGYLSLRSARGRLEQEANGFRRRT